MYPTIFLSKRFYGMEQCCNKRQSDKPHHVQAQLSFKKTCVKCHIFMSVSLKIEELNTVQSLRGMEVSDYWTKNGHFNV